VTKPLYLLVATETGPDADPAGSQDAEYTDLGSARHAWVGQVEHYLADGASVRLHGPSDDRLRSCTATYRRDGEVVLEIHLFIEDGYDTDCSDYDESDDAFDQIDWDERVSAQIDNWGEIYA
jgi:hypothetical protein